MNIHRFQEISSQFGAQTILVIGDVMLDSYLWGKAERISPEAPVPIIHIADSNHNPGGAGNVALNLIGLTSKVHLFSVIGDDSNGQILSDLLKQHGILIDGLEIDRERPTTVKTRVIAQNQQVVRVDRELKHPVAVSIQKRILSKFAQVLPDCDAVILEDYNKGLFAKNFIGRIIQLADNHSKPVYVDPKKHHFFDYNNVRLLKPNFSEFQFALGNKFDEDRLVDHGIALRSKMKVKILLVTQGVKGISIFTDEGQHQIPTKARRVHDVSGAGDTVISTFTLADLAGATAEEAAILANYAAGRVCEEVGVVPITLEMLTEMVNHHHPI